MISRLVNDIRISNSFHPKVKLEKEIVLRCTKDVRFFNLFGNDVKL